GGSKFADGSNTKTFTGNSLKDELKAQLVGGCSYTITETSAPAGYEVPKTSATIKVAVDGKVTVDGECDFLVAGNESSDGVAALTFTDNPIEIDLSKVDEKGITINQDTLDYAEFTITGKLVSEDGNNVVNNDTVTELTTKDFKTKLSGRVIAGEVYKIEETKAPDGYKLTKPFYIQLDKCGQIVKRGNTNDAMSDLNPATDMLVVSDAPIKVTFRKVDESGNAVSGAKFTLTRSDAGAESKAFVNITDDTKPSGVTKWTADQIEWTSTDVLTGITFTNNLIADVKYKLHEERVLYHEVMANDIVFHITDGGEIAIDINSKIPNNNDVDAAVVDTDKVTMTIRNPIIKGSVTLTKYYKDSSAADNVYDDAHVLTGAVYTLTRIKNAEENDISEPVYAVDNNNGNYSYSDTETGAAFRFVTNENGQINITGLPEGTYEFLEVDAPKAYHINIGEDQKIQFKIENADKAHVILPELVSDDTEKAKLMDTRVNAKISLVKLSGDTYIAGAVFDVEYSETFDGDYSSIGQLTTDENGQAIFDKAKYTESGAEEGLRRGFYRLTEKSADGNQMMNTTGGCRNTISFEIGNETDHEYKIDSTLQNYLTNNKLSGVTISNNQYIKLTDNGVADTPIPTKSVTVTKKWEGDTGLDKTFRPGEIKVQLYRVYNGGTPEKVQINGTDAVATLSLENSWSHTWSNLPSYVTIKNAQGEETTYLYTYTVEEIDKPSWYEEKYEYTTTATGIFEKNVQDGDTTAEITNTLSGGKDKKTLTIKKTLGGGSSADTFNVRIKLNKDGTPVGNNNYGYYLDTCKVYNAGNNSEMRDVTPDPNGWMAILDGEYIKADIPKGITYEVEEMLDVSQTYVTASESSLKYTPRYDANKIGTIADSNIETTIRNAVHKTLNLVKKDDSGNNLAGTKIKIAYVPLAGSSYVSAAYEKEYTTNTEGQIVDKDGNNIDLTFQGTYEIREVRASNTYITPTENDGTAKLLATVNVDAEDKMKVVANDNKLVTVALSEYDSKADVTIKNEKTKVPIGKTIDFAKGEPLAGATLEIYKADDIGNTVLDTWKTDESNHIVPAGRLSEDVVYRLHEKENSAPVGYLESEDVYFILDGTYTEGENRYSRILLTYKNGDVINQNTDGDIYGFAGIINGVLRIVDMTIKVPVTLNKVIHGTDNSYEPLKDVIFTVTDNDIADESAKIIGTAKTGNDGFLVWSENTGSHTSDTTIVLQQNVNGYTFTETYAPDNAYNDGRAFTVNPKDDDFKDYLTDSNKKFNIRTGNMESVTDGFGGPSSHAYNENQLVVNEQYKSTVTLFKYDADEEAGKARIEGTEFTLYHAEVSGDEWTQKDVVSDAYSKDKDGNVTLKENGIFTTDAEGKLSIEIHNKGFYILRETRQTEGYELGTNPPQFRFILTDKASQEDNISGIYGYDQTNILKRDATGVPNTRIMGSVTLRKVDGATKEPLNGVEYILTRTDPTGTSDSSYLLHEPVTVTTGRTYKAEKLTGEASGTTSWKLTESDGESGVIKVEGLNWGTYKLQEKTELSGYVKSDKEYEFEVKSTDRDVTVHDDAYVVTNAKNKITLHKLGTVDGGDAKNLAGAVFEIHEGSGNACGSTCSKVSFYDSAVASSKVQT
ncbi:MAG: SpaA isopeptide-forming pilin-related protein, partial [Clostridiales bacterium]|nr:SpaA isopeptide-forming pilin-related protein [Clostridiales bacterium]